MFGQKTVFPDFEMKLEKKGSKNIKYFKMVELVQTVV